jgi:hypothetical protein
VSHNSFLVKKGNHHCVDNLYRGPADDEPSHVLHKPSPLLDLCICLGKLVELHNSGTRTELCFSRDVSS